MVAFSVDPGSTSGVPTVQHGAVWPVAQLVWLMQLLLHSELVDDPAEVPGGPRPSYRWASVDST